MTVIIHHEQRPGSDRPNCCMCGERPFIPYIEWTGPDFVICGPCCLKIRERALMSDIIHCAAVHEMCELIPNNTHSTLKRVSCRELGAFFQGKDDTTGIVLLDKRKK
jgi:hypothetical protein